MMTQLKDCSNKQNNILQRHIPKVIPTYGSRFEQKLLRCSGVLAQLGQAVFFNLILDILSMNV